MYHQFVFFARGFPSFKHSSFADQPGTLGKPFWKSNQVRHSAHHPTRYRDRYRQTPTHGIIPQTVPSTASPAVERVGNPSCALHRKEMYHGHLQEDIEGDVGAVPRCRTCGSEWVVRDAWACWNPETGLWELETVFDHVHCHQCEGEATLVWSRPRRRRVSASGSSMTAFAATGSATAR